MTRFHPLLALRRTWGDVELAVSAAREYRQSGDTRNEATARDNPATSAIPL